MTTQYEIGVLGAGNAAEGIVHSILRNSVLFDDRMIVSNRNEDRRNVFSNRFHIAVTGDNRRLVENSSIIILAVKPQQFAGVVDEIADLLREDQLIVSIMAGVSTAIIEAAFSRHHVRVIRAMPNLPIHVGAGMTGVCKGAHAQDVDLLRAQRIFEAGGRCIVIEDETQMDAVTAISGSGPAYFYYFVEALTEAGTRAGLTPAQADILAKQTCFGAARMMLESGEPPSELRHKVTSPGGTTQAALQAMSDAKVSDAIVDGVLAAWHRSQALGR